MKLTGNSMVSLKIRLTLLFCELFCITIIEVLKKLYLVKL